MQLKCLHLKLDIQGGGGDGYIFRTKHSKIKCLSSIDKNKMYPWPWYHSKMINKNPSMQLCRQLYPGTFPYHDMQLKCLHLKLDIQWEGDRYIFITMHSKIKCLSSIDKNKMYPWPWYHSKMINKNPSMQLCR